MRDGRARWIAAALMLALALGPSGCATLTRGRQAQVEIESLPSGATVWVDGRRRGKTPMKVMMIRDELHSVRFSLDGHEELTIQTDKQPSVGFIIIDGLLSGLIGLLVDASTGALYDIGPNPLRVLLSPKGERCATGDCVYLQGPKVEKNP